MKGDAPKWEPLRRLRYGALLRFFRHRYGNELPEDDAGRDDLWLLVCNVSLAVAEPKKKMRHVIELWAPWMAAEERDAYVEHVWGLDIYQRIQTGEELGRRLNLTNAEREELNLWQFRPVDKTPEELAEIKRERERARRERKRRQKGVRSRKAYLADMASRPKPWTAEGVTRRTWERRRKAGLSQGAPVDQQRVSLGESEIIVLRQRTDVATPNRWRLRKEGFHGGVMVEDSAQVREDRKVEESASSSSELRTHHATLENRVLENFGPSPEWETRMRVLDGWGANAKRKPWTKPTILSDEPRDFTQFPVDVGAAA